MIFLLNILILVFSLLWLHRLLLSPRGKIILPAVIFQGLGSTVVFIFSITQLPEYMDGIHFLIIGGASQVVFWLWSVFASITIRRKQNQSGKSIADIAQSSLVLLIPIAAIILISQANLKIGG